MSVILPGKLYLGNVVNVNRLPWLNQHNIHTIVCVASKDDVTIKPEIYASKRVYQWEIMDHTTQVLDFEPIIQQIEESMQYGAVLHLRAFSAKRRVVTLLCLMYQQNRPLQGAI